VPQFKIELTIYNKIIVIFSYLIFPFIVSLLSACENLIKSNKEKKFLCYGKKKKKKFIRYEKKNYIKVKKKKNILRFFILS
jgi:hypothetical protein